MGAIGLLGLLLIVGLAIAVAALVRTGLAKGPVPGAVLEGLGVPDEDDNRVLVARWRDRARRWRSLGGLPLVLAVVVLGLGLRGEVRVGIGGAPLWTDPLLVGLLGAFAGALGAELHHLRRRPSAPRAASLQPRVLGDYLPGRSRARLAAALGIGAVAGVAQFAVPDAAGPPYPALLAVVTAGLVLLVQRTIVVRSRPALPDRLLAADDAIRRLAVRSVDAAGAGLVLLLALWQVSLVTVPLLAETGLFAVVAGLTYLTGAVVALVWWWRGGPTALVAAASGTSRRATASNPDEPAVPR